MEYCVCGHVVTQHLNGVDKCYQCIGGYINLERVKICFEFKLDNLRFIEDEAKKRGLV